MRKVNADTKVACEGEKRRRELVSLSDDIFPGKPKVEDRPFDPRETYDPPQLSRVLLQKLDGICHRPVELVEISIGHVEMSARHLEMSALPLEDSLTPQLASSIDPVRFECCELREFVHR